MNPVVLTCATPLVPMREKHACGLEEGQRVGDRFVVAVLDGFGDLQRCQSPQCRHRFDRGEGEVVPGDGGGVGAGEPGDEAGQFTLVGGAAAVALGEHFPGHGGADFGAHVGVQRCVGGSAEGVVVLAVGAAQAAGELVLVGAQPKWAAQFGCRVCAVDP